MGYKDDNYSTKVCGHHPETCTCRDWDTKEEPKTNLEKHLESLHDSQFIRRSAVVTQQETLEEAAEKYRNTHQDVSEDLGKYLVKAVFQDGAQWQQKISYSEEEVETLLLDCRSENPIDVSKWFERNKKK